jgi:hypothetical protein
VSGQDKLKKYSADELLKELRAREAKKSANAPEVAFHTDEGLKNVDSETIVKELRNKQKVIYGTDNRVDLFAISDPLILGAADGVVALFDRGNVVDNGNGTSTLQTQNFGTARNLCATERFRDQPLGCFCSGFLVAPDIIATAGHCADNAGISNVRFVFGFRMRDATNATTVINNTEIYSGTRIIGRELTSAADWALVQTDRPVTNHSVVQIRRAGRIADNQGVYVIGHPVGLPTKFADGANVRDNSPAAFFIANLDTYGGNSGSPVFNRDNHVVEGILVRGETDFTTQGTCNVSLVCPDTGCRGEDSTRTTVFQNLISTSSWLGWEDLGGVLTSGVGVSSWAANRLDCFVKGTDNAMWHKWWNGSWSGWENLGGVIDNAPAAVSWGPNRIDCFVRGMNNHMFHKWWNGSAWSGWEDLGGIITAGPAVSSWASNRLDCFVKGTDNAMWHKWWDGSAWRGWEGLGGVIDNAPAAVSWGPNRIDTFARGMDNHMWHKWWA